jgi:hypothetical protein
VGLHSQFKTRPNGALRGKCFSMRRKAVKDDHDTSWPLLRQSRALSTRFLA